VKDLQTRVDVLTAELTKERSKSLQTTPPLLRASPQQRKETALPEGAEATQPPPLLIRKSLREPAAPAATAAKLPPPPLPTAESPVILAAEWETMDPDDVLVETYVSQNGRVESIFASGSRVRRGGGR
jgi:hypothetical protein